MYIDLEIPFLNFRLVISLAGNSQWSGRLGQKHLHPNYEFGDSVKNHIKGHVVSIESGFWPLPQMSDGTPKTYYLQAGYYCPNVSLAED